MIYFPDTGVSNNKVPIFFGFVIYFVYICFMETTVELSYDDSRVLRAVSTYPDGRKHTMFYPSIEVYLQEQRFHRAADHKRWMAVLWDKHLTFEECLAIIDEDEKKKLIPN